MLPFGGTRFLAPATVVEVFTSGRGGRGKRWVGSTIAAIQAEALAVREMSYYS